MVLILLRGINSSGCHGPPPFIAAVLTVNPLPTITTTGTATSVCNNATSQTTLLAYSASTNSPTSYSIDWNSAANTAGLADQGNTLYSFAAGGGTLSTIAITAGTPAGAYSGIMTVTNASSCSNTYPVSVPVNPNVTPTFTAVAAICSGATLSPLPTTSLNGITGTWAPALDNTATTTYTFTPTAGLCATPQQ